jgi:hypothetical protein
MPQISTRKVASDGGSRKRRSQPTAGDSSAESSRAIASGTTTMLTMLMKRSSTQPTTPTTISRHDHAAAIRSECGTSASSRLDVDRWSTGGSGAGSSKSTPLSSGPVSCSDRADRTDSRPVSYARRRFARTRCKRLNR